MLLGLSSRTGRATAPDSRTVGLKTSRRLDVRVMEEKTKSSHQISYHGDYLCHRIDHSLIKDDPRASMVV